MSRMPPGAICLALLLSTPLAPLRAQDPPWLARGRNGMVASDSPEASSIGAAVLTRGGNAFDAAVATSFALTVARPESTGLGGGGFMLAYVAREKRCVALDFRETAPATATPERYEQLHAGRGTGPSPSIYGGNAVGTPGQLAGLAEINRRFGTRPLAELIEPALHLAEDGFLADEYFADACRQTLAQFERWPELQQRHAALLALIAPGGTPRCAGDTVRRPDLALALRLVAEQGAGALYGGPLGEAAVRAVQAAGGALRMSDLRDYRVREREPLRFYYRQRDCEYEFVSMPPPSSAGVCLAEFFNVLEALCVRSDLHPVRDRQHVIIEAMKHAFADRARWLGDPDFTPIPLQHLMSDEYAGLLARRINPATTLRPEDCGSAPPPPDDGGTSHFCVADREGNIVALTETINGLFGSLVVAEPFGIILNNEMDDFATAGGAANLYGLVQSERNLVGPGKRPLSSMAPTIIFTGGRPLLAIGASGGPLIISSVAQVALHVLQGEHVGEAMTALRLHHQWQPDEVYFSAPPPGDLVDNLRQRGHAISPQRRSGAVQAIHFLPDGTMIGVSEPSKGGRPAPAR